MTAWVLSVAIAVYLIYRNRGYDRWNASFILAFSTIQLWEAGIWSTEDPQRQALFVKLIAITLAVQPLVQMMGAERYTTGDKRLLRAGVVMFAAIVAYTIYITCVERFWVTTGPSGHLVWNRSGGAIPVAPILYMVGVFIGLMYALPTSAPLLAIGALTLAWSISRVSSREVGSYWCYSAVAYSVVALFS
jgi:hypothetical protein